MTGGKDPNSFNIRTKQAPAFTNYDEIRSLSLDPHQVAAPLQKKLDTLFHTPFIENRSKRVPRVSHSQEHGKHLRITSWNTEQSRQIPTILSALENQNNFLKSKRPEEYQNALYERGLILDSDVIVLQEMDIGHPRSAYLHTPKAMAKALGMNYAYGVQYLEVDPVYLGVEDGHIRNKDAIPGAAVVRPEDRGKYHGLFGNAVLSRYPIKRAEIVPLKGVNYDWYEEEAKPYDIVEKTRRASSQFFFRQRPHRELKIGTRAFLRVDLHMPELPLETLTVINVHLEIKLPVEKRRKQLEEILEQIKDIKNPVVLAGDFNSSVFNIGPTSFVKEVTKTVTTPSRLGNLALSLAEVTQVTRLKDIVNFFKNYQDPLAGHVPIFFENIQKETFGELRDFRFDDGGAFDFRGDSEYSSWKSGVLSNSNQRCPKGFVSTFTVNHPIGPIGHEKLDWIFVKSFLRSPYDARGSRELAPQFGRTLKAFNRSGNYSYSDHDPITVVLPLQDSTEVGEPAK